MEVIRHQVSVLFPRSLAGDYITFVFYLLLDLHELYTLGTVRHSLSATSSSMVSNSLRKDFLKKIGGHRSFLWDH